MCCVKENNCRIDHSHWRSRPTTIRQHSTTITITSNFEWQKHEMCTRLCVLSFAAAATSNIHTDLQNTIQTCLKNIPIQKMCPYTWNYYYSTASNGGISFIFSEWGWAGVGIKWDWESASRICRQGNSNGITEQKKKINKTSTFSQLYTNKLIVYITFSFQLIEFQAAVHTLRLELYFPTKSVHLHTHRCTFLLFLLIHFIHLLKHLCSYQSGKLLSFNRFFCWFHAYVSMIALSHNIRSRQIRH